MCHKRRFMLYNAGVVVTAPVLAAWLAVVRVVVNVIFILGLRMRASGTSFPLFEGSFSFELSIGGFLFIIFFFTGFWVALIIQLLEILYFLVQL